MATPLHEDLKRHAGALRGLAAHLVGTNDAADLVQEVTLTALDQGPRDHSAVGSWLRAVLRNKAYKKHRGDNRRQGREQAAHERTGKDSAPAAIEVAAHRETISRLHSALLALPSPFQETLFARYFEDLTPTEIAARMSVSLATVKSRLRRALEQLRGQMESSVGLDWRAAFAGAFGLGRASTTAAPAAAIFGAMTLLKLLGAAAATALVLWAVWPDPAPPTGNATAATSSGPQTATAQHTTTEPTERRLVTDSSRAPAEAALQPAQGITLTGRCVDHAGTPLSGVLAEGKAYDMNGVGLTATVPATSGPDGSFEVVLPAHKNYGHAFTLHLDGHCEVDRTFFNAKRGDRIEAGDVVLPTACTVAGSVVDEHGAPQASVKLNIIKLDRDTPSTGRVTESFTTAAADGRFTVADVVPPGRYAVRVLNRLDVGGADQTFTVAAGQAQQFVELKVEPPMPKCRGVIVDAHDIPIAKAGVSLRGGRYSPSVMTDDQGRFTIEPDPHKQQPYVIEASAKGYRDQNIAWSPADKQPARIVLTRKPGLQLHVVEARSKRPIAGYVAWLSRPTSQSNVPAIRSREHPGGRSFLTTQSGNYFVVIDPTDTRFARSQMVPVTIPKAGTTELTIGLTHHQTRRLVIRAKGKLVANATVELVDCGGTPATSTTEVWELGTCRVYGQQVGCLLQMGRTDAQGTLQLRGPSGPLCLRISGGGLAHQFVQPIRLDQAGDLVIDAEPGAVLTGKLEPAAVARKLWQRQQKDQHESFQRHGLHICHPDGTRLHQGSAPAHQINEDGTFRIEGIPQGTWHVVHIGGQIFALATITVDSGEQLERDLDARSLVPTATNIRILKDGNPISAALRAHGVHMPDARGKRFETYPKITPDETGRATVNTWPGELLFAIPHTDASGKKSTMHARLIVPEQPGGELLVDLRTGSLNIRCVDATGKPAEAAAVRLTFSPFAAGTQYATDQDGSLSTTLGQGTYALAVLPQRLSSREAQQQLVTNEGYKKLEQAWLPVTEVIVTGTAGTAQTIHLPPAWQH